MVRRLQPPAVMPLETTTETPPAGYVTVAKEEWQTFFDTFTKMIEGRIVEIEVIGIEFGDQVEAESLPLNGLTYDPKADTFYVYVAAIERDLGHAIPHPREILVRMGAAGLEQVVVVDSDRHEHIVRLRQPLMLPEWVR
jgi:uncharacterized protein YuzE